MKKYILSCVTLLLFISIQAQNTTVEVTGDWQQATNKERERIRDSAEFIFEGVVVSKDYYIRKDSNEHDCVISSTIIKIKKVFRGNLNIGTVELILTEPNAVLLSEKREHYSLTNDTTSFIYFCRVANEYPYNPKFNINNTDNNIILTRYSNMFFCINKENREGLGFNGQNRFKSKGAIYRYIASFPNVKMPVLIKNDTTDVLPVYKPHPSIPKSISQSQLDSLRIIRQAKRYNEKKKQTSIVNVNKTFTDSTKSVVIVRDTASKKSITKHISRLKDDIVSPAITLLR